MCQLSVALLAEERKAQLALQECHRRRNELVEPTTRDPELEWSAAERLQGPLTPPRRLNALTEPLTALPESQGAYDTAPAQRFALTCDANPAAVLHE